MDHSNILPPRLLQTAQAFIAQHVQPLIQSGDEIVVAALIEYESHWEASYQTRASLAGDIGKSLAGNVPIRIEITEAGPTAIGFEQLVRENSPSLREVIFTADGEIEEVLE